MCNLLAWLNFVMQDKEDLKRFSLGIKTHYKKSPTTSLSCSIEIGWLFSFQIVCSTSQINDRNIADEFHHKNVIEIYEDSIRIN